MNYFFKANSDFTVRGLEMKSVFLTTFCIISFLGCSSNNTDNSAELAKAFYKESIRTGEVNDFSGIWQGRCSIKTSDFEESITGDIMVANNQDYISILNIRTEIDGETIEFFNNDQIIFVRNNELIFEQQQIGTIGSDGITVLVTEENGFLGFVFEQLTENESGFSMFAQDELDTYEIKCPSLIRRF